jgi:hypothetical protein
MLIGIPEKPQADSGFRNPYLAQDVPVALAIAYIIGHK